MIHLCWYRAGLHCKAGKEFGLYYEQVEAGRKDFKSVE